MKDKLERSDVERAVISLLLRNNNLILEVDGKLAPNDFQNAINKHLFREIIGLYNTGFSTFSKEEFVNVIVRASAFDSKALEEYVDALYDVDIKADNILNYIDILLDLRLKRDMLFNLKDCLDYVDLNIEKYKGQELLGKVQEQIFKVSTSAIKKGPVDVSELVTKILPEKLANKEHNLGVPSPFPELDKYTLGFKRKRLYVVSARPNEGKSSFALNCALYAAYFAKMNRARVLYLDTEMAEEEWFDRATSNLSGVDGQVIEAGLWERNEKENEAVKKAHDILLQPNHIFFEHIPDFSLESLTSLIRQYVYMYNIGFIIYDYIKLPESYDFSRDEWEIIYGLARKLKYLAKILDVPILALLQQNREGDSKSRVGGTVLAGGDGVLKEADGVFFLNQKSYKEIEQEGLDYGTHIFQVYKLRNGPKSFKGFNLDFKNYCYRFYSARKQSIEIIPATALPKPNGEANIKMLNTLGRNAK